MTHSQWLNLAQNVLVFGTQPTVPAQGLSLLGLQVRGGVHGAIGGGLVNEGPGPPLDLGKKKLLVIFQKPYVQDAPSNLRTTMT